MHKNCVLARVVKNTFSLHNMRPKWWIPSRYLDKAGLDFKNACQAYPTITIKHGLTTVKFCLASRELTAVKPMLYCY